jgi:hypothetical protein
MGVLALCSVVCGALGQQSNVTCSDVQQAVSMCFDDATSNCAVCLTAIRQFASNQTSQASTRKRAQMQLFNALSNNSTLAAVCIEAFLSPGTPFSNQPLWTIFQSPSVYCFR